MKVALVEVSHWHLPLYLEALAAAGVEIAAVSDTDPAISSRVAERLGCRAHADYAAMLREVRPDFVFAFGRHREMPAIASHLIRARFPFSMEKPMGTSAPEVEALRLLAESHAAFVAVPFVFRCSPIGEAIGELRAAGTFGELTSGSFRFIGGPPSRYARSDSAWLLDPAQSGGGCTINLGVHLLDLALGLLGPGRVDRVYGVQSRRKYGTPVEDHSTVVLSTADGVSCTIETGYAYPSDREHPRHLTMCLTTTKGCLEVGEGEAVWAGHDGERVARRIDTDTDHFYAPFVRRTLAAFAAGESPVATVGDMVRALELVDAAYRSGREGGAVSP